MKKNKTNRKRKVNSQKNQTRNEKNEDLVELVEKIDNELNNGILSNPSKNQQHILPKSSKLSTPPTNQKQISSKKTKDQIKSKEIILSSNEYKGLKKTIRKIDAEFDISTIIEQFTNSQTNQPLVLDSTLDSPEINMLDSSTSITLPPIAITGSNSPFIKVEKAPIGSICMISRTLIDVVDEVYQCTKCGNFFLSKYLHVWLSIKKICPVCKEGFYDSRKS